MVGNLIYILIYPEISHHREGTAAIATRAPAVVGSVSWRNSLPQPTHLCPVALRQSTDRTGGCEAAKKVNRQPNQLK